MSYGLGVKIHRYRITKFNSASCSCRIYPLYRLDSGDYLITIQQGNLIFLFL